MLPAGRERSTAKPLELSLINRAMAEGVLERSIADPAAGPGKQPPWTAESSRSLNSGNLSGSPEASRPLETGGQLTNLGSELFRQMMREFRDPHEAGGRGGSRENRVTTDLGSEGS
jgi:hypothetical protein